MSSSIPIGKPANASLEGLAAIASNHSSTSPDARQALDAETPILNLDSRDYDRGWRDGYQHARTGLTSGADYPRLANVGADGPESPVTAHRIAEIVRRLDRIDYNVATLTTKSVKHGESLDRAYKRIDEIEAEDALTNLEARLNKRIDAVGLGLTNLEVRLNERITGLDRMRGTHLESLGKRILDLERLIDKKLIRPIDPDPPDVPETEELEQYAEVEPINPYADREPRQLLADLVNAAQRWQMYGGNTDAGKVQSAEVEAYRTEIIRRLEQVWNT